MNKKIFSKGLYFEGLRQLKIVGIVATVILCVLAAAVPVMNGIEQMNYYQRFSDPITRETINGMSINSFLFGVFLLLAPLMTLILFGFLNKRRTSDFYHSIPHTRICVFFSFIASILTWTAVMILASSLAASLGYLLFIKYFIPLYADLLIFMLAAFVISFMAISATAIAVSITGTPFSNVLFTVLILLLPRIIIALVNGIMIDQTPILSNGNSFFLFENGYNLYTTVIISIFDIYTLLGGSLADYYLSAGGIVYTLVLGLIYLALAAWIFVKRKSESAERSAPSKLLQHVYRILVTMAFCMIPCLMIFTVGTDGYGFDSGDYVGLVVLYILAVILYFVYELITTRKWKNLVRALPALGIVLLCNAAVIGGLFGLREFSLSFTPDADEITGISVVPEKSGNYYGELYYNDYVNSQMGEIVLDSPEAKKIVAEGLTNAVEALKKYGAGQYWRYGDGGDKDYYYTMTFRVSTKGGSRVREIKLSQDNVARINELLIENEQYFKLWTEIPDPATDDLRVHTTDGMWIDITADQQKEIVRLLKEDIAEMGFEAWYDVVMSNQGWFEAASERIWTIYYPIRNGKAGVNYYSLNISYENMPKTSAYLLKLFSSDETERELVLNALQKFTEYNEFSGWSHAFLVVYFPDSDGKLRILSTNMYGDEEPKGLEQNAKIAALLNERKKDGPVEMGDIFIRLTVHTYDKVYLEEYGVEVAQLDLESCVFIPLDQVTMEELEELGFYSNEKSDDFFWDEEVIYD